MQLLNSFYSKSYNCFLSKKQNLFFYTPKKIVQKIHLPTSFNDLLKPKIWFDAYSTLEPTEG